MTFAYLIFHIIYIVVCFVVISSKYFRLIFFMKKEIFFYFIFDGMRRIYVINKKVHMYCQ